MYKIAFFKTKETEKKTNGKECLELEQGSSDVWFQSKTKKVLLEARPEGYEVGDKKGSIKGRRIECWILTRKLQKKARKTSFSE